MHIFFFCVFDWFVTSQLRCIAVTFNFPTSEICLLERTTLEPMSLRFGAFSWQAAPTFGLKANATFFQAMSFSGSIFCLPCSTFWSEPGSCHLRDVKSTAKCGVLVHRQTIYESQRTFGENTRKREQNKKKTKIWRIKLRNLDNKHNWDNQK